MTVDLENLKEIWKLVITSGSRGIPFSEIKMRLNIPEEKLNELIALLHKLYLIEYLPTSEGKNVLIRKRYILGNPLDEIPCLGCPSINDCTIGGSKISTEGCIKFLKWLENLSDVEDY